MTAKLRNMTSLYIFKGDKALLLYRQGSRVVNDMWIGSAGGHFEPEELTEKSDRIIIFLQTLKTKLMSIFIRVKESAGGLTCQN